MKDLRPVGAIFLLLAGASMLAGQEQKTENPTVEPSNLVLLVRQEIQPGRSSEREKLEVTIARACDRQEVPSYWIDLQSLTGAREALFFDPFDSFEQLEQAGAGWRQFFATHPELARAHEEIKGLLANERRIVAVRRDDMGYLNDKIDLSTTRFVRVLEVHLFPGHEGDFVEASRILAEADRKIEATTSWVVYQVNAGMATPAFLIFMPMARLAENDDLLNAEGNLWNAAGEEAARRLEQIARESYAATESNLYEVRPELSHVSREFAAGDQEFWRPKTEPEVKTEGKPSVKPTKKVAYEKLGVRKGV
jgi:hypothetical protein